jgi:hypothetical protein
LRRWGCAIFQTSEGTALESFIRLMCTLELCVFFFFAILKILETSDPPLTCIKTHSALESIMWETF